MALNSYRFITMMVAINLLISISMVMYENPREFTTFGTDDTISNLDQYRTSLESETGQAVSDNVQSESSFGSFYRMTSNIWQVIKMAFFSFPVRDAADIDNDLEKIFAYALNIFRSLMYVALGLLVLNKFKNKDGN